MKIIRTSFLVVLIVLCFKAVLRYETEYRAERVVELKSKVETLEQQIGIEQSKIQMLSKINSSVLQDLSACKGE